MRLAPIHLIHLLTRVALRLGSPAVARGVADGVARIGVLLDARLGRRRACGGSVDDRRAAGRRWADEVEGRGTCLTRALTVSACLPGSEVVIAVTATPSFSAHAWVELGGRPLRPDDPRGEVIARLGGVTALAGDWPGRQRVDAGPPAR